MSTSEETSTEFGTTLRRRGAVVLAAFAVVWVAAGLSGVARGVAFGVGLAVAVGVTASLVALAVRTGPRPGERRLRLPRDWRKQVGRVNLTEFAAVFATVALANLAGQPEVIPPAVCLVVGLHFLPLARLFDQPQYVRLGWALSALAAVGLLMCVVDAAAETTRAVVGLGAALCLWGAAADVTVRR